MRPGPLCRRYVIASAEDGIRTKSLQHSANISTDFIIILPVDVCHSLAMILHHERWKLHIKVFVIVIDVWERAPVLGLLVPIHMEEWIGCESRMHMRRAASKC